MNFLVGSLVLSGGERIIIVWSDGRRTEAVYQDTFSLASGIILARRKGFEPLTLWFVATHSIQLS